VIESYASLKYAKEETMAVQTNIQALMTYSWYYYIFCPEIILDDLKVKEDIASQVK
jgi:hypothetical protein